ncbi:MAG: AAA family ATPase [Candidatus Paceibacterota bacterium]|jgi:broad-specificity NMP kinase
MQKILITGMAGSGKSTICNELERLGCASFAIEDMEGMFNIYHKGTRNFFEGYSNLNPKDIENAEWLCDTKKLKELVDSQENEMGFYCGVSSDINELLPFFDIVFVLKADAKILNERLKNREGTDNIGNNQEGRDIILNRKDEWEKQMEEKHAIFVDANKNPDQVVKEIINKVANIKR